MVDLIQIARRRVPVAVRSVCLVAFDWTRPNDPRVPLGHASLEASLRTAGIETTTRVYSVNALDPAAAAAAVDDIAGAGADVVAVGVYAWNDAVVRRLIRTLRPRCRGAIVLGGPQVTYAPVGTLTRQYPEADVFVRGAGEDALVRLLGSPDDAVVDGVVRARGPSSSVIASVDLTRLPSPYLSGSLPIEVDEPMARWETSRGCSYGCTFCAHAGAPEQRRVARRGRNLLRQEIDLFVDRRVRRLNVLDPLFNATAGHAIDTLDDLTTASYGGEITFQCRFGAMRSRVPEMLGRFERLNTELEFGLQTADDLVARAVNRGDELDRAAEVIAELRRRGIRFLVSLIYGLPHQTLASFEHSVAWCKQHGVPRIRAYPLSLLVGTELWYHGAELGLIEGCVPENGDVPVVVATPWMRGDDVRRARALAATL